MYLGNPSGFLLDQTPLGKLGAGTLEIASVSQVLPHLDPWGCVIGYGTLTTAVQGHKPRPSGRCPMYHDQEAGGMGLQPSTCFNQYRRYRLYPHPPRQTGLAKVFGWARVVWNDALALRNRLHQEGEKYPGATELQKRCITQAKRTKERGWLAAVSNVPLQQSIGDLDKAFRSWWTSKDKVRAPRFKRRHYVQDVRFRRGAF